MLLVLLISARTLILYYHKILSLIKYCLTDCGTPKNKIFFLQLFPLEIMSDVKHRKHRTNFSKTAPPGGTRSSSSSGKRAAVPPNSSRKEETSDSRFYWLNAGICLIAMVICGYKHANLMYTIHENNMWFSNIKVIFLLV